MSTGSNELNRLIQDCIDGNRYAQQLIFERYYGKMMGVCLRYTRDEEQAKDVLQEGFIKVFEKMEHYGSQGSFEGWMRRIVVNTAIDYFRKARNAPLSLEDKEHQVTADDPDPSEAMGLENLTSIKAEMAMEALRDLSPAYRTVFNLYVIEDYTHREIAEMLNISEGTSKSNLAKAKMKLKELLQDRLVDL